jgi:YspA, cpYpsA-related SLOG family
MRVLISGTRLARADLHEHVIADALLKAAWGRDRTPGPHVLVHGAAPGVDTIAEPLAEGWGWEVEAHPADWSRHGNAAGPIRNAAMVAAGADVVLAFPSDVRPSRGTRDLIAKAQAAGLRVVVNPLRVAEVVGP